MAPYCQHCGLPLTEWEGAGLDVECPRGCEAPLGECSKCPLRKELERLTKLVQRKSTIPKEAT